MNYTVSLLLLVAIGLAEPSGTQEDDDNQSAKRELLEGNYGLRIQPSVLVASNLLDSQQVDSESYKKNIPAQEYGPPRYSNKEYNPPVAKISDVLTGQGPPFPVAIADHLYSPVSIYQPRLGSFEISPPVPSQLRYAEHKIISDNFQQILKQNFESLKQPQSTIAQHEIYERQENLRNANEIFGSSSTQPLTITDGQNINNQKNHILNFEPQKKKQNGETTKQKPRQQDNISRQNLQSVQNFETDKQTETQQQKNILQQNILLSPPVFSEIRPLRLNLEDAFLPHLEQFQPQSRPLYSDQIIQQIFPQIEGYSQDFFQQINELENQLSHNTVQYFQYSDDEQNNADGEKKKDEEIEDEKSSQQLQSTSERQTNTTLTSTSTPVPIQSTQSQAVSYARFSLGLPLTSSDVQMSSQQVHQVSSSTSLPQLQSTSQQLFQPLLQAQIIKPLQQLQPPQLFQPLPLLSPQPIQETTPPPSIQPIPIQPLYLPLPPQPTQQSLTSTAPFQTPFTANQAPQRIGVIRIRQETTVGNQPTLTTSTQNKETFSTQSQNQDLFTTLQPQFSTSPQITLNSESTFVTKTKILSNDVPVSTTIAPRSTSKPSSRSTESPTTTTPGSIVSEFESTVTTNPTKPPHSLLSTSTPQIFITSTPSPALPPRPDLDVPISSISTSIQSFLTLAPNSQSPNLQTSELQQNHQAIQSLTPTKHPVQDFKQTIQPFPTLPPLPPLQPLPTLQTFSLQLAPQQLPTVQPVFAAPQPLPTLQPFPIIPQPLPTLQPYLIQPLPQPKTPAISATPIHRYQTQTGHLQIQPQQQQGPFQLVPVQQEYQAQIQLLPTPSPPLQQLQIQVQPQLEQGLSQFQPVPQPQSQQQSSHVPQDQSKETKSFQYGEDQINASERNEAAIAHAHQLLYNLYSPFIQQPVYQETVIQPQAASVAYPASFSSQPMLFSSPALSSPQFFGK